MAIFCHVTKLPIPLQTVVEVGKKALQPKTGKLRTVCSGSFKIFVSPITLTPTDTPEGRDLLKHGIPPEASSSAMVFCDKDTGAVQYSLWFDPKDILRSVSDFGADREYHVWNDTDEVHK